MPHNMRNVLSKNYYINGPYSDSEWYIHTSSIPGTYLVHTSSTIRGIHGTHKYDTAAVLCMIWECQGSASMRNRKVEEPLMAATAVRSPHALQYVRRRDACCIPVPRYQGNIPGTRMDNGHAMMTTHQDTNTPCGTGRTGSNACARSIAALPSAPPPSTSCTLPVRERRKEGTNEEGTNEGTKRRNNETNLNKTRAYENMTVLYNRPRLCNHPYILYCWKHHVPCQRGLGFKDPRLDLKERVWSFERRSPPSETEKKNENNEI